jgi:hypothetical protein
MSKELTKKQEAFAQAVLTESTLSNAYRVAYDCEDMSSKTINEEAGKLFNHPKVTPRVQELRKKEIQLKAKTNEEISEGSQKKSGTAHAREVFNKETKQTSFLLSR